MVALALLGLIAAAFLSGLATAAKATFIADEQATAESLARSQMEYVKNHNYATSYTPASIPDEYEDYEVAIAAEPLYGTTDIQKITVTIEHLDKQLITLDGYKVDRDD